MTSRTTSVPPTKPGAAVQSKSVSSQFSEVNTELENFRQAKREAEDKHKKVHDLLNELKQNQVQFLTKIRSVQEILGDLTRKRDMHQTEKSRLRRDLDHERKALETCALHTEALTKESNEATEKYASEMQVISDQVAASMQEYRDLELAASVVAASMKAVVLPKLPDNAQIRAAITEAMTTLEECEDGLRIELARQRAYRVSLDRFNDEPEVDMDLSDGPANVAKHLDIFYGSDEEVQGF